MNSKMYLANGFSISMLNNDRNIIEIKEINPEEIIKHLGEIESVIGHEGTAQLISKILGIPIPVNRIQIKLDRFDVLYVFQLMERLPEGSILNSEELSKIKYKWYKVMVIR